MAQSAQIGFYPELRYPESMLTPLPGFKKPIRISVSESYNNLPQLGVRKPARVRVIGSSWSRNSLTLSQAYFKTNLYLPRTVDARAFNSWRSEEEKWHMVRESKNRQMAAAGRGGGGGIRVTIPLKSKAVESLFGEGGAGLEVSGMRRISFAGNSSWTSGGPEAVRGAASKFPSLEMDQTYQFNITGTIGSKISVKVNQDSRVNIPLANRLELRFKGSEDDVIKTIEAGNTTLSLPGAQMLRYSSQVRGLFGIKTEAQVGPFKFTGIASQEKANTERTSIEHGAKPFSEILRDYQYETGVIFDIGLDRHFESVNDSIVDFQLYRSSRSQSASVFAKMYLDPRPIAPPTDKSPRDTLESEYHNTPLGGDVELIDPANYSIFSKQRNIILDPVARVSSNQALGIWLKMRRPNGTTYEIGNLSDNSFYILKLLKPVSIRAGSVADGYAWKNVYRLPRGLGVDADDPDIQALSLKVYKGVDGTEDAESNLDHQDGPEYIEILGIDQVGTSSVGPDGTADFNTQFVDFERGLITLPSRTPFNADTSYGGAPVLEDKSVGLYVANTTLTDLRELSRYYLVFENKVRSNSIRLGGSNIVAGSEVVMADGKLLVRNTDYDVIGNTIELKSEDATNPAANIQVDYESAPLFTVEKKTLLGASLQYDRTKDFRFSITTLFKSDKATTRKPKVGQETSKMFAYDINGALTLRPNFLTKALNALPLIRAKGPSTLSLSAELARSHPNPNVDGEAFVDDFEGSRREASLGMRRGRWQLSSRPVQVDRHTTNRANIFWYHDPARQVPMTSIYDVEVTTATSGLTPFNIFIDPDIYKIDSLVGPEFLFVELTDTTIDTTFTDSLEIDTTITPTGIVDTSIVGSPDTLAYDESLLPVDRSRIIVRPHAGILSEEDSWGGITSEFSTGGANQSDAELFEMRIRVTQAIPSGFMHIDFGEVSQDVIPNGKLDHEGSVNDRVYDEAYAEDVGLDGMTDAEEIDWYSAILTDPTIDPLDYFADTLDPSFDNFSYADAATIDPLVSLTDLPRINGTQNNHTDPDNRITDSEELSLNSSGDLSNNYFSYKLSLDTVGTEHDFYVEGSEKLVITDLGDTLGYWITVRIPIQDPLLVDTAVGLPTWVNIESVRIWFDSLSGPTLVEIAEMGLVSSNWEHKLILEDPADSLLDKSSFRLSVIGTSEDRAVYSPPEGVTGSVDQINNITEPEQSLRLEYKSFIYGDTGLVFKTQTSANYMGYGALEMFVHGDAELGDNHNLDYFFRLGTDSLNYYEFRSSLDTGWVAGNEVSMDFNALTALKDIGLKENLIDSITGRLDTKDRDPIYRVVGAPSLRSVRYFSSGIVNPNPADTILGVTGEVWLDELRLSDVRNDPGTALRASASGNIGDFITSYSFGVSFRDAFYRDIARGARGGSSNSLGSGKSDLSYNFSLSIAGARFFPPSLGLSLPLRFSYSKSISTPLLVTAGNSDIVLPENRRIEERTIAESRSFSVRETFKKKTKNPLFTVLLNPLSTSFSYNRSKSTSPTIPSAITENYSANATYNIGKFPALPKIPVFFMFGKVPVLKKLAETRLNVSPTSLRMKSNFSRNLNVTVNSAQGTLTSRFTRNLNSDMRTSVKWLSVLNSNLSINIRSDLRNPEWLSFSPSDFRLGKVMRFQQGLNHDYSPTSFGFVTHKLTLSSSYSEVRKQNVVDLNANPSDSAVEPLEVSQNLRLGLSGTFDLEKFLGGKGKPKSVQRSASKRLAAQARAQAARKQGDTAKADSIMGNYDKDKKGDGTGQPWFGSKIYNFGRGNLRKITSFLDPISGSFDRTQNRSVNGLRFRPSSAFRFGFSDNLDVPVVALRTRQNNNFTQSRGWRLSSGVKFLGGGLTSKVEFSESRSTSYPSVGSASRSTDKAAWPRLSVSIRPLRGFEGVWGLNKVQGLINSFIRRFTPKTAYTRRVSERHDITNGIITNRNESADHSPLIAVVIPIKRQISVTASYDIGTRTSESFNSSTGVLTNASRDKNKTIRVSTQYSFRAPKGIRLPIFGRVKINSNVSMKLDVLKRFTLTEEARTERIFTINSKRESFSVNFNTTYSFSSQLRGGMSAKWTDSKTHTGSDTHTRELRFYVEMRF